MSVASPDRIYNSFNNNLVNMSRLKCSLVLGSVVLLCIFATEIYAKRQYTVALFLHDDEKVTEMAFQNAVDRFNSYNVHVKFQTVAKIISRQDIFSVYNDVCEVVSSINDLVGVFGPTSPTVASIVGSVCANLEIPHMQVHWTTSSFSSPTSLNVFPDGKLLSAGIGTVAKSLSWNQFAILYQDENSLIRLQKVFALQENLPEKLYVRQIKPNADNRMILKELKQLGQLRIIIDCDSEDVLQILHQAKEIEMLDFFHHYFLTSLDAHTLNYDSLNSMSNISTIRMLNPEDSNLQNAIRDWEVGEMFYNRDLFIAANEVKLDAGLMHDAVKFFADRFYELYLSQRPEVHGVSCQETNKLSSGFRIANYLKIRNMEDGVTGKIEFTNSTRSSLSLQLVEIIHGTVKAIAEWKSDDPHVVTVLRDEDDLQKQMDIFMQNTTFIVSSRIGVPYLNLTEPQPGQVLEGNDRYEGYSIDLIDHIAKIMNISYKFVLAADNKYGGYDKKTKSWNGLIKDLLDRKAHLAICDLTITHQRRSVVDFSLPFMTLGVSILYSKSKPVDRDIFAFMDPFDTIVWMYIVTAYISFSLIVYLVSRMSPGDWESAHPCDQNPEELENAWDLKNCFWLSLGSTMSQGCDILPKGISSRMGISMWWFFILIINSSYTANLAAFLTMVRMGPSIDNAEALSKQTKIKYGTVEDGATQTFFRESNFSTYQRMWMQMSQSKPSVFEKSNADGVKRVKNTKNQMYAFLMESSSIEYVVERDCELKPVGGRMDSKGYGIAMPMNSPYLGAINRAILKLQENGTLSALKSKWWKEMHGGGACDEGEAPTSSRLGLTNVGGVFVVLGVGVGIAFIISTAEFLSNVKAVALEEHKMFAEVLVSELKFAVKFWITTKSIDLNGSNRNISNDDNEHSLDGNAPLANGDGIVKLD